MSDMTGWEHKPYDRRRGSSSLTDSVLTKAVSTPVARMLCSRAVDAEGADLQQKNAACFCGQPAHGRGHYHS